MPRICLILIAGLDQSLLERAENLHTLSSLPHRTTYEPARPAVTCTAQATLTTGQWPSKHGIICNGLYTHNQPELHQHLDLSNHADARKNVSFWEQSNSLLQAPRFWQVPGFPRKKTAMLFWQNSMPAPDGSHPAADIVLTPKPTHTPDGKTLTACWSNPADLYPTLVQQLGPFPLHNYWSPVAGLPSSQWIARAAEHVWTAHRPDLQLVYIPHLDFDLQRLGPPPAASPGEHHPVMKAIQDVDALLAPLAKLVRDDGATLFIAGDYGVSRVSTPLFPNLALRRAGLLATKPDVNGKQLIDFEKTAGFAMVDHQIAYVYSRPDRKEEVARTLANNLEHCIIGEANRTEFALMGLANARAGDFILIAETDAAWFAHDYWFNDDEKPQWQFTVDIHNKPGFDPRELFFDPTKKCIAQDPRLVKGSHGGVFPRPVLLCDAPIPEIHNATQIAPHLAHLLQS
jgi:hypothetical protein